MANWYEYNQKRFQEERTALASDFPLLTLRVFGPGLTINNIRITNTECAVVSGIYVLPCPDSQSETEYKIALTTPNDFPKSIPHMYCVDPKLPRGNLDRHIMGDCRACLGVPTEISMRWRLNPTLVFFLKEFVDPFLVWQAYYDIFQKPPAWGGRSHHGIGILEFYADLLGLNINEDSLIKFMQLLARKNHPNGHEPCPCGSGGKLKNCHKNLISDIRQKIDRQYVLRDLKLFQLVAKEKAKRMIQE